MGKEEVAIVGTGPAGLVAAFALHNDLNGRFNVTVFEVNPWMSLDGHSYEYVDPHGGQSSRVDVPMRVFSGPYYQNLFNLLEYLEISSVERRFLFAFADDVATISRYYFFHGSNNHRSPMICRRSPGVFGILSALWTFFTVLYCYVWFSIACFWIPPKVGPMPEKTETIGQYLTRLRLPEFFIHGYIIPLFSGVASSPHELFLKFPAVYLADYKRQTHMFHHRTLNDMALLQRRLTQGISLVYYAKVIKVERYNGRLKLHYQNTRSGEAVGAIFNRVILAVNPEQISAIYPPTKYVMDGLQTCDVSVVIHQDYKILPEESTELVRDSRSELMAIHVKDIDAAGKATVATHAHPCGVLVTVWSGKSLLVDIDPKKTEPVSHVPRGPAIMVNGNDGVYVCGGWTWDGFALLEGCVWSGLSTARSLGAELPPTLRLVERTWHS